MNRRKRLNKKGTAAVIMVIEVLILAVLMLIFFADKIEERFDTLKTDTRISGTPTPSPKLTVTPVATATASPTPTQTPIPTPTLTPEEVAAMAYQKSIEEQKQKFSGYIEEADLHAAMYDYDKAISILKGIDGYSGYDLLKSRVSEYEAAKSKCVVWKNNTQISHIFFHSLIADTQRAFGEGSKTVDGYNRYMTTISEFKLILEQMYSKGYVLVSIHDIAKRVTNADGTQKLVKNDILLPEGKTPFVLSQDDVNYYDYMDADGGFAAKLVIGSDGKPTCQYVNSDNVVVTGDYDVVPLLDRFIEEHPDFSYRGAKGILAVTGYEGALGYETAPNRYEKGALALLSPAEKEARLQSEISACKEVVACLKEDGWEFASHSYGHSDMGKNTYEKLVYDTDRWLNEVGSILGETDIYIYPYGSDICPWQGYSGDKYEYYKSKGFWYFCNVDSAQYWIQLRDDYMRMGRINLDGERMSRDPEKVEFFIDAETVLDKSRPYSYSK